MKKENSITLQPELRASVKLSNPFTWAKVHALVLKLRGKLPEPWKEVLPVETVKDLQITLSLLTAVGVLLLPFVVSLPILATLAYSSYSWIRKEEKGGRK